MNKKILLLTIIFSKPCFAQEIYGVITDTRRDPIVNASINITQNGKSIIGTITDFDGVYDIKLQDTGYYCIEVSYIGYQTQKITRHILLEKQTIANFFLASDSPGKEIFYRGGFRKRYPLINK